MIPTVPDSVKAQQLCESLSKEASRIEEDCIHSAKSHFNAADCWRNRHYWFGVPATMLGAAAGAAIVKDWPEPYLNIPCYESAGDRPYERASCDPR